MSNIVTTTLSYLNLNSAQAWIVLIIGTLIIGALFKPIRLCFKLIKFKLKVRGIVKKLTTENNDKMDQPGNYLASLFLTFYNEQGAPNNAGLHLTNERFVKNKSLGLRTMAKTLEKMDLVYIYTENNNEYAKGKHDKLARVVWKSIDNLRNKKII